MSNAVATFQPQIVTKRRVAVLGPSGLGTLDRESSHARRSSADIREVRIGPSVSPKTFAEPEEVAAVIQVWEGTVLEVHLEIESMSVRLAAKMGIVAEHTADISLDWVSEQDRDLVTPGAVFYLTLSRKLSKGKSRQNYEELRFRRMPAWTAKQAQALRDSARALTSKFASPRLPE